MAAQVTCVHDAVGGMVNFLAHHHFPHALCAQPDGSLDFVIIALGQDPPDRWLEATACAARALRPGGVLFVQGTPANLPEIGVHAEKWLQFKYWIAIESAMRRTRALPTVHAAVLMFVKGEAFRIAKVRVAHQTCRACAKTLKDWGGKSHLMHPKGTMLSDVWRDLPPYDNYSHISPPVLDRLLAMLEPSAKGQLSSLALEGIIGPKERIGNSERNTDAPFCPLPEQTTENALRSLGGEEIRSCVIQGDAVEVLAHIPDESVDLVFADPPYNLDKGYALYKDSLDQQSYLRWCESWLMHYIRVLKPTGALFVLNLPRWAMNHAVFLNRHMCFQNWIVWDALSEPRGKLMPAHYALLFYTKRPNGFTFNYDAVSPIDARVYCLRKSCIRDRKARGDDEKELLTDFWWDVHRIKHRQKRDWHPCQLPERLMERIIRLTTNPGDLVLDAFAGTGTTALVAARLGRRYIAIDLDPSYIALIRDRLENKSEARSPAVRRCSAATYNKRALQLELQRLAEQLGRLPTPEDVARYGRFDLELFRRAFPTWGKALKAAKLIVDSDEPRGA